MLNRHLARESPLELREDLFDGRQQQQQQPEAYHPRPLTRQAKIDQQEANSRDKFNEDRTANKAQSKWLAKFSSQKGLKRRLSHGMARLSSLDSTRSSSSFEVELSEPPSSQQAGRALKLAPVISISSNEAAQQVGPHERRLTSERIHSDYYGRPGLLSRRRRDRRLEGRTSSREQLEEEDEFDDPYLQIPYSSTSAAGNTLVRQQPAAGSQLDDPLDDRQGMNASDRQFLHSNRPSLDGSLISEPRKCDKSAAGKGAGSGKGAKRRSRSPNSLVASSRRRHPRRGLLSLVSRFKLTRKHESIASLQLSILNCRLVSLKSLDKDLQSFLPNDRMSLKEFEERVRLMRKYQVLANIEYRFASRYETYVCRHATRESNQPKNNYKRCIPYDYNRVVLKSLPNVPDSDYMNASHIDSCLKPNAYIAAQGPNENTIEDFWRMIWEQKSFVIVMLTKVFDFIRVMCNQYWPVSLNKPERYGNLEVTLLYEEPLADFVIRTIRVAKLRSGHQKQTGDLFEEEPKSANEQTPAGDERLDEEPEESDYSEDSSASEELVLSDSREAQLSRPPGSMPSVRSPRYVTRSRRRERSPGGQRAARSDSDPNRLSVQAASADGHGSSSARSVSQPSGVAERSRRPPNEFLHPLFSGSHLAASSTSVGSDPATPMTPRTPSSAGLDRSSATRRAVKKKRRARVKNSRPKRTQFMVPDESQLADDDDDDELDDDELAGNGEEANKNNERIIYQFHYNSWASHTCPFISSLLHFRRRVRICMDEMSKSGKTGPTVVHCNDGCGRTGTYLCIDANLELAEEDNVFDVFNYTKKMRQSRKFLIENFEQYKFVYDTIEESIFCGKTWFPVSELHKRLKHKSQRNPVSKKNEYLREYEKITRMTSKFSIGDCAGGHRVENREKNRDVSTVPPDNFRPYLSSFQTNDSTDYINAVFVDGYTRSKEYIVTEWPLHRTISDFWSLVYDHDCNSVILLANPGESSNYPSFLPSEKELRRKFGPVFSAEMVSYTHYQNIKSWIYTINKKIVSLTEVIAGVKSEAKTTQVFQITCWPQGHRVPTSTNALVELMNMVERWRQRTTYGPVCVVSLNGKSRAGVYCAANVAIEQVVQHSEVDVFQAVKTVRRHRPQLIENMTEYKYCYDLILHYVLHYVNQSQANG